MGSPSERRKQDAALLIKQGHREQGLGHLEQAAEFYQASLKTCPTAEAHTLLAWAYAELGRTDEAIVECRSALQLEPDCGNALADLGGYLVASGRFDDALPHLEQALSGQRCERKHFAHVHLARVFAHRGMLLKAAEEFREALKIEPAFEVAAQGLIEVAEHIN